MALALEASFALLNLGPTVAAISSDTSACSTAPNVLFPGAPGQDYRCRTSSVSLLRLEPRFEFWASDRYPIAGRGYETSFY